MEKYNCSKNIDKEIRYNGEVVRRIPLAYSINGDDIGSMYRLFVGEINGFETANESKNPNATLDYLIADEQAVPRVPMEINPFPIDSILASHVFTITDFTTNGNEDLENSLLDAAEWIAYQNGHKLLTIRNVNDSYKTLDKRGFRRYLTNQAVKPLD